MYGVYVSAVIGIILGILYLNMDKSNKVCVRCCDMLDTSPA